MGVINVFIVKLFGMALSSTFSQKHLNEYRYESLWLAASSHNQQPLLIHSFTECLLSVFYVSGQSWALEIMREVRSLREVHSRGWGQTQKQVRT